MNFQLLLACPTYTQATIELAVASPIDNNMNCFADRNCNFQSIIMLIGTIRYVVALVELNFSYMLYTSIIFIFILYMILRGSLLSATSKQ